MAYHWPDPQVHHWLIPRKGRQAITEPISARFSSLFAIFLFNFGVLFTFSGVDALAWQGVEALEYRDISAR